MHAARLLALIAATVFAVLLSLSGRSPSHTFGFDDLALVAWVSAAKSSLVAAHFTALAAPATGGKTPHLAWATWLLSLPSTLAYLLAWRSSSALWFSSFLLVPAFEIPLAAIALLLAWRQQQQGAQRSTSDA